MQTYPIPMVPGPVSVPEAVRRAYSVDYGSGDLEPDYFELYARAAADLQTLMGTENGVVIQAGEGMLVLWSALKSCLQPGDRVLAVGTGVFGYGIGEMARSLGAEVRTVNFDYDETIHDLDRIHAAAARFKPKMITAVHCETPSGTLNPLAEVGRIKAETGTALFYVDAVASIGGVPMQADEWGIDLCLGGTQKCLSTPPDLSFVSVSEAAWQIIEGVAYAGYDALKPFRHAVVDRYFPYTPNWHATAGLSAGLRLISEEGPEKVFARHTEVAEFCRRRLQDLGVALFPAPEAVPSPTVTAARVPPGFTWPEWDQALRRRGLVVGGSFGPLDGKVFRLGHMGSQARMPLMEKALEVIAAALKR